MKGKVKPCFRCERPGTTDEHVPPKCLFPAQKDFAGRDYRKNLISVPSCEEHNLEKSKDDEFLMAALTGIVGNNSLAYEQLTSKVTRAMAGTRFRLLDTVIREPRSLLLANEKGQAMPALTGRADVPRLCRVFEAIALGLYYEDFGHRFAGQVQVFPMFLTYDLRDGRGDPSLEATKWFLRLKVEQEAESWPAKGENPEVFFYQFGPEEESGLRSLRMCFFEGADVVCALSST